MSDELTITVDPAKMTLGDLRLLDRARAKQISDSEALDFFNRVIVGGVEHLPLDALEAIWGAIFHVAYGKGSAQKNSEPPSSSTSG